MKIEVDEIMTELPQTPPKSELISRLRSTAADMDDFDGKTMKVWDEIRAKCLTHRGSDLPRLMFEALLEGFSELMVEAADALTAPQRCSDETARETVGYQVPDGMKLVYVKRWRTIVPLPVAYVDEIVEALRPLSSDETAHNVRDATIKEIARYLDEEGHGIPAEKVRFMGPAVMRPVRE